MYDYRDVDVRRGGDLPHWNVEQGLYFTTFGLRDAIPARIMQPLEKRRDRLLYDATRQARAEERLRLEFEAKRDFQVAVERALDRNYGSCVLGEPAAADIVVGALKFFDGVRYDLLDWSVMPTHVHNVFRLGAGITLDELMHTWKRYMAREINKLKRWKGKLWQREYFDVTVRDRRHLDACLQYVLDNPRKAGTSAEWTGWSPEGFARCGLD